MAVRARNIVSLCAGCGGLELGIALALHHRGETARGICYVEREAAAAASLVASMEAGWFHPAPVWSDLTTFDGRPWRGLVHILASGDPCQDNSVAGKQAGSDGERFLAPEVVRIAKECRPDLIFRENVTGNADGQLEAIVPALEGLGYRVAAGIFSSAETGNTMRRERLFIMALADGGQSGDRGLQCGGELRLLEKGDGVAPASRMDGAGRGRHRYEGQALRTGRHGVVVAGVELERSESIRCREGGTEHAREQGRRATAGASDELGRTGSTEPQAQQPGQHHSLGRQVKGGHPVVSGGTILPPAVIPGPADNRGWIDVLDRWPELQPALSEEEAQSIFRRIAHEMANRVERLRATGNGVDPIVAAYAYLCLSERLRECHEP